MNNYLVTFVLTDLYDETQELQANIPTTDNKDLEEKIQDIKQYHESRYLVPVDHIIISYSLI